MALKLEDFYHGAVLRKICRPKQNIKLAIIGGDKDRTVYSLTGDNVETRLYIKHGSPTQESPPKWQFQFKQKDLQDIKDRQENNEVHLALVCISEPLSESLIAFLNPDKVFRCIDLDNIDKTQTIFVTLRTHKVKSTLYVHSSHLKEKDAFFVKNPAIDDWDQPGR